MENQPRLKNFNLNLILTCNIFKLNFIFHCDRTIVTGLLEENFLKAFKHFMNAHKELI